jgi:hypothetical protein
MNCITGSPANEHSHARIQDVRRSRRIKEQKRTFEHQADAIACPQQSISSHPPSTTENLYDRTSALASFPRPSYQSSARATSGSTSDHAAHHYASPYVYKSNDSGYGGSPNVSPQNVIPVFGSGYGGSPIVSPQNFTPVFGSEGYKHSPFAMADDFVAWLFGDNQFGPGGTNVVVEGGRGFESVCESKAEFIKQPQGQLHSLKDNDKKVEESSEANTNAKANAKGNDKQAPLLSPKDQSSECSSTNRALEKTNNQKQGFDLDSPLATVSRGVTTLEVSGKDTDQDNHLSLQLPTVNHSSGAEDHIMQWVDATKDADPDSLTPTGIQCMSTPSSLPDSICDTLAEGESHYSTKAMIVEVMYVLQNQYNDPDLDNLLPEDNDYDCTRPTTDGLESPKSNTRSASAQSGASSAQSGPSSAMTRVPLKSFDRDEDGEPPTKRSGGGHGPFTYDTPRSTLKSQMPCPMSDSLGCMGTNPTISEMLRSLQNRHRIVICTDCCSKLEVPDQERKPENILKRHLSIGCERRCISRSCVGMNQSNSSYHRRTEKCPNWKALSKEIRWSFVWALLNPGLESPSPDFISGIGFEHSSVLTPCKEKSRDRGLELCRSVMADLDAKTSQLQSVEHELEASKQHNSETQQRCSDKIANLENIIETLLERLRDKNVDIPPSLQKRLTRECPTCIIPSTPSQMQKPLTPESTPENMVSIAQLENGRAIDRSTWASSLFDSSAEASNQQAATQLQQAGAEVFTSTTRMAATQNSTSGAHSDGINFEDFLHAPIDNNAEAESHNSSWAIY